MLPSGRAKALSFRRIHSSRLLADAGVWALAGRLSAEHATATSKTARHMLHTIAVAASRRWYYDSADRADGRRAGILPVTNSGTAMQRRTLLQLLLAGLGALSTRVGLAAQGLTLTAVDEGRLRVLADVVLPGELGVEGRARVVTGFVAWLREYRPGADMEHGYGFPRLRRSPPSPGSNYAAQLAALDAQSGDRRAAVEAAIRAAKIERLPARPDGGHVATDLMAFYFNGSEANDLAYRAAIGRDDCRGLDGSENRPAAHGTGAV